MPTVPIAERKVLPQTPQISTPNVGTAVPGAFGEQVAEAQTGLGEAGVKSGTVLLDHINRMRYWDEKSKNAIYENEFSGIIDGKLHNTDTKEIDRDGKKYPIPAGYLDRSGEQARGAIIEYDTEVKPLITQYANKIKNPTVRQELIDRLSTIYTTNRDKINVHEATQWRKSKVDSFEASLVNDSARAALATDAKELSSYLDNITKTNTALSVFNGDSVEVANKRQNEYVSKAVENAVTNINDTGYPEVAQKLLDNFKDKIFPDKYEKLKKNVSMNWFLIDAKTDPETAKKRISEGYYGFDVKETDTALSTLVHYKELEKKQNQELQEVRNNGAIDKMLTGQFSLKDVDNELTIPEDQGGIPRKILLKYKEGLERNIGQDLKAIVSQKTEQGRLTKQAIDAKKYLTLINSFIDDNTDKWRANEYLANAYADGIVSPQEMKVLAPLKKSLDDIKFNRSNGPLVTTIKKMKNWMGQYSATDSEIALGIKDLLNSVGSGDINEHVDNIIQSHIKKTMPTPGVITEQKQLFHDAYGNAKIVYLDAKGKIHIDDPAVKQKAEPK